MTPSQRHPWLLPGAVLAHRARRRARWLFSDADWATDRSTDDLAATVHAHGSPLVRDFPGVDLALQHGKVHNLRLASARLDGLLIRPGETFSFNRVVGSCSRRRGYVDGLRLSRGRPVAGVGGGICQLANLLHWMVLHSPLTVVERSVHSVDPFPDDGRVVPWGVGCTIVYNYVDLVVRNDTPITFQVRTRVDEPLLRGELRADQQLPVEYAVTAHHEHFERGPTGVVHRSNELWRSTIDRESGELLATQLVRRNRAVVRYPWIGELPDSTPAGL